MAGLVKTPPLERLCWRGVVPAQGFFFSDDLLSQAAARRRMLAWWRPGARIQRVDGGWLLLWSQAAAVACERSPGTPLVQQAGRLCAAPLTSAELARLDEQPAGVVLVRNARELVTAPLATEDAAQWLDLSSFEAHATTSLGADLTPPPALLATPAPLDARAVFGAPPAAPGLKEMMEALQRAQQQAGEGGDEAARRGWQQRLRDWMGTPQRSGWWQNMWHRLSGGERGEPGNPSTERGRGAGSAAYDDTGRGGAGALGGALGAWLGSGLAGLFGARGSPTGPAGSPGPGWEEQLLRMLAQSGAARSMMSEQSRYLMDLIDMLERGDFDQGLRHAIGLGDQADSGAPMLLGKPVPRLDLQISLVRHAARGQVGLPGDAFKYLRHLYRKTYDQLLEQGRVDEAVFVLVELLNAAEEAVSVLERHGKRRLAAELAEARNLAPGLVVRQWFLAGEAARAVHYAHRTGAFADACRRLDQTHPDEALQWRQMWAQHLVAAGRHAEAVEVLWNRPGLRPEWMLVVIGTGGVAGARMLARWLRWRKDDDTRFLRTAIEWLQEDTDPLVAPARLAFLEELRQGAMTPRLRGIATGVLRRVMAELEDDAVEVKAFHEAAGLADPVLRADLPRLTPIASPALDVRPTPIRHHFTSADVGLMPVHDAVLLTDGWCAVALGESGLRILNARGRTVHHFDVPAFRLVVSDNATRLLVLAPRGEAWRIARFDAGAAATPKWWAELRLDTFAETFDGSRWLVVSSQGTLHAIDTSGDRPQSLWTICRCAGEPVMLARNEIHGALLSRDVHAAQPWTLMEFSATDLQLRRQRSLEGTGAALPGVNAQGHLVELVETNGVWNLSARGSAGGRDTCLIEVPPGAEVARPVASSRWLAGAAWHDGVAVWLRSLRIPTVRATLQLDEAATVRLRIDDECLIISDDVGRVLVLELRHGRLLRNFRLTP
jgi:hypothetical protein